VFSFLASAWDDASIDVRDFRVSPGAILELGPGERFEVVHGEPARVCPYCDGPRSMTERTCPGCGAP